MTDEDKAKAVLAEKDQEIADLKSQLAKVGRGPNAGADEHGDDVRARAVAEAEARDEMAPTPSQDELDRAKLGVEHPSTAKAGGYKTRQSKPA